MHGDRVACNYYILVVVIRTRIATAVAIGYLLAPTAAISAGARSRWLPVVWTSIAATYVTFARLI
jgi:hypothetical protein